MNMINLLHRGINLKAVIVKKILFNRGQVLTVIFSWKSDGRYLIGIPLFLEIKKKGKKEKCV